MQTRSKTNAERASRRGHFFCGVLEGFYGRPWTADQRRDLFVKMKHFGMNTYLYAPKDDLKHRAEWRQLYTTEETELLQSLIKAAKAENITFVYALSPGVDIVYSNDKEIKALHDKAEQVRCLGCEAFALLFDDIETTMNDVDKKQYSSIALAQLHVANALYEFLKCPYFFFCPVEYCESRATPSLEESEYLNTLGKKLLADIRVLWTGPRVISRQITVEHIRRVAAVLRRKPVIWDNLHANDYDPKRVFLGPFTGRTVGLKEEISGLLLNPNCRYEANFIPFYTLAEWNSCHADAELEEDAKADAILEAGGVVPVAAQIVENASPKRLYHPLKVLHEAVLKWMDYLLVESTPSVHPSVPLDTSEDTLKEHNASNGSVSMVARELKHLDNADSQTIVYFSAEEIVPLQAVNSLSADYSEPMDLAAGCSKDEQKMFEAIEPSKTNSQEMLEVSSDVSMESSVQSDMENSLLGLEQVETLVDMFYLPFEHGRRGVHMLQEFAWLHDNAYVMRSDKTIDGRISDEKVHAIICDEWKRRYNDYVKALHVVTKLYQQIAGLPNRNVVQELFQYVYDAQSIVSILEAVVLWMANGQLKSALTESDCFWRRNSSDAEPWTVSGGFVADLQKLLFTSANLADLFLLRSVIPLSLSCYTIRPFEDEDVAGIRHFYNAEKDEFGSCVGILGDIKEERFFDEHIGQYVSCATPRTSFVAIENMVANSRPIVAAVFAALNAKQFAEKIRRQYLPRMRSKYNAYAEAEKDQSASWNDDLCRLWQRQHESIADWEPPNLSDYFYEQYPSQVNFECCNIAQDALAVRRLICVTALTLSYNGSCGFFIVVRATDTDRISLCARVGLVALKEAGFSKDLVLMGHSL